VEQVKLSLGLVTPCMGILLKLHVDLKPVPSMQLGYDFLHNLNALHLPLCLVA